MAEVPKVELTRCESLPRLLKVIFFVLTIGGLGLVVFYLFGFHIGGQTFSDFAYYYLIIGVYLPLVFLLLPARKKDSTVKWYDLVLAVLSFALPIYFFLNAWAIRWVGWVPPTILQFVLALTICLLVLEGARRMAGILYPLITILLGLYPIYAEYLPRMISGKGFPFTEAVALNAYSTVGLIGIPAWVMGQILIGFLLFAGFLMASGAGNFFIRLSLILLGRFRGGPAKVAVVASGFFGSLSGSVGANIVATGSFTIPTMKRLGYPPHYAGAIEACASTGGLIMPPVMGATAFVMAMLLGVDYATVIIAASIPAILYYFGLLMQVDAYAAKVRLKGLPQSEIPSLKATLKEGWPFLAVLLFLVWGLLYMRWGALAPFYATGLLIILSFTSRKTMMTPRKIMGAFTEVGKLITLVTAVIVPIGIINCGLVVTGAAAAFAARFVALGEGNVFLLLLAGVIICYILGMAGMQLPAYLFLAATLAPAVIKVGNLPPLSVHLFLMYYTTLAGITPPVALGAFIASGLAGSSPIKTAFTAIRLGAVLFFIPFFFVFNPALILQGSGLEIFYCFALALVGIGILAAGLEGYLVKIGKLKLWTRPFLVVSGLLIAFPEWSTSIIGAAITAVVIALVLIRRTAAGKLTAQNRN